MTKRCAVLGLCISFVIPAQPSASETLIEITTRPGVAVKLSLIEAAVPPVATVILFSGGKGRLRLDRGLRRLDRIGNFLIRSRALFAARGLHTISVDAPSDRKDGLTGFRTTVRHAKDIAAVIAWARRLAAVPVWLIGTSRGTISAANGAARLRTGGGGPDGIVLTASVTEISASGKESVYQTPYRSIRGPVIVVHHRADGCEVTPAHGARTLAERLKGEWIEVSGGSTPQSRPCGARSAHGFLGVEAEVVARITERIRAHGKR